MENGGKSVKNARNRPKMKKNAYLTRNFLYRYFGVSEGRKTCIDTNKGMIRKKMS